MGSNVAIGSSFEKFFKRRLEINGWDVVRIPDGAKQLGQNKIIRVKSPFDFVATSINKAFFCDTKTTIGETYPYSAINKDQVDKLLKIEQSGFISGFVIHFRQNDTYGFASAKQLSEVMPGQSIKSKETVSLGKELNIEKLFSKVEEK